jgi:hypothetical protein
MSTRNAQGWTSLDVRHREVWANQIKAFTAFFSDEATVNGIHGGQRQ